MRARLSAYTGGKREKADRRFYELARAADVKTFGGYIKNAVSASGVYSIYSRIYFALNNFLRASALFRSIRFIIRLAYSGTAAFAALTAIALIFPAVLVFSAIGAAVAVVTRGKTMKNFEHEIHGRVFFVFGTARGENRRWICENGTLVEIKTSVSACDMLGFKKKSDGRYVVHISSVNFVIKRLSEKKDVQIIKVF